MLWHYNCDYDIAQERTQLCRNNYMQVLWHRHLQVIQKWNQSWIVELKIYPCQVSEWSLGGQNTDGNIQHCKQHDNARLLESVSCSVVSDSMSPHGLQAPGSSVHGILQAKVLDQVAISFSRGSSQLKDEHGFPSLQTDSLPSEPGEGPFEMNIKRSPR